MEYTIAWGGYPQDILVVTRGHASVDDAKSLIEDVLSDERYRPGIKLLLDHSGLAQDDVTAEDVRALADFVVERRERVGSTVVAVVSPSQDHYGFARMWRTYAQQDLGNLVGVFYSRDAAIEWLAQVPRSR